MQDPTKRAILAFNVPTLQDAQEELAKHEDVVVIQGEVVYRLIEDYQAWMAERSQVLEASRREDLVHPGKMLLLEDYIFRASKPAIIGVRVLAGRIRVGQSLLREDGRIVGRVRSMRSGEQALREVATGSEVAVAMDGPTIGRQINPGDVLYVDVPEGDVKPLEVSDLNADEKEVLESVKAIKRKEDPFWGM